MDEQSGVITSPLSILPGDDKQAIRQRVWDYLEEEHLAQNPRPVHHRIPNYKGSTEAGDHLTTMDMYKKAQVLKVDPDKPLEQARFRALQDNKNLLVPTPRLRKGLLNKITPPIGAGTDLLRTCATKQGINSYSEPVGLDAHEHVDLMVLGSVAVSQKGWRIGKGEGYSDLEFSMMVSMGAVDERTDIVSIVHDCQVFDLPDDLFGAHDVPVDYIVTPTRIIKCDSKPRPTGIIWSKLTKEKYESIPVLKELRYRERQLGKDVKLADGVDEGTTSEATKNETENRPTVQNKESADMAQGCGPESAEKSQSVSPKSTQTTKKDPGLFISSIPRGTRFEYLKAEIRKRGVTPLKTIWLGGGSSLCIFDTEEGCEDATVKFEGMQISGQVLKVERAGQSEPPSKSSKSTPGEPSKDSEAKKSIKQQAPHKFVDREDVFPAVYVGSIPRGTQVKVFKAAVRESGVNPLRLMWIGRKSCAFLIFETKDETEEALAKLKGLTVQNRVLKIELGRKTKPETEDDNAKKTDDTEKLKSPSGGKQQQKSPRSQDRSPKKQISVGENGGARSPKDTQKLGDLQGKREKTSSPAKGNNNDSSSGEKSYSKSKEEKESQEDEKPSRRVRRPSKTLQEFPTVEIKGIPKGTRTSEFKALLRENEIHNYRLVWRHRYRKLQVLLVFFTDKEMDEGLAQLEGLEVKQQPIEAHIIQAKTTVEDNMSTKESEMNVREANSKSKGKTNEELVGKVATKEVPLKSDVKSPEDNKVVEQPGAEQDNTVSSSVDGSELRKDEKEPEAVPLEKLQNGQDSTKEALGGNLDQDDKDDNLVVSPSDSVADTVPADTTPKINDDKIPAVPESTKSAEDVKDGAVAESSKETEAMAKEIATNKEIIEEKPDDIMASVVTEKSAGDSQKEKHVHKETMEIEDVKVQQVDRSPVTQAKESGDAPAQPTGNVVKGDYGEAGVDEPGHEPDKELSEVGSVKESTGIISEVQPVVVKKESQTDQVGSESKTEDPTPKASSDVGSTDPSISVEEGPGKEKTLDGN